MSFSSRFDVEAGGVMGLNSVMSRVYTALISTLLSCPKQGEYFIFSLVFLMTAKTPSVTDVVPNAPGSSFNQLLGMKGASAETVHLADCMSSILEGNGFWFCNAYTFLSLSSCCISIGNKSMDMPSFCRCSTISDVA